MNHSPRKSTARELSEQAAAGAIGVVPLAGGVLSRALTIAMGWTFNRRMQSWLDALADAVDELQQSGQLPDMDELAGSDAFADAVSRATRAAQATHQVEKLDALRNAVLNSVGPQAPDVDEQSRFIRYVDEFTPAHLRILKFCNDPGMAYDSAQHPRPNLMAGSRRALLTELYTEFEDQTDWCGLLVSDLTNAGLLQTRLDGLVSAAALWVPLTTALGSRFLQFIADPTASLVRG